MRSLFDAVTKLRKVVQAEREREQKQLCAQSAEFASLLKAEEDKLEKVDQKAWLMKNKTRWLSNEIDILLSNPTNPVKTHWGRTDARVREVNKFFTLTRLEQAYALERVESLIKELDDLREGLNDMATLRDSLNKRLAALGSITTPERALIPALEQLKQIPTGKSENRLKAMQQLATELKKLEDSRTQLSNVPPPKPLAPTANAATTGDTTPAPANNRQNAATGGVYPPANNQPNANTTAATSGATPAPASAATNAGPAPTVNTAVNANGAYPPANNRPNANATVATGGVYPPPASAATNAGPAPTANASTATGGATPAPNANAAVATGPTPTPANNRPNAKATAAAGGAKPAPKSSRSGAGVVKKKP